MQYLQGGSGQEHFVTHKWLEQGSVLERKLIT